MQHLTNAFTHAEPGRLAKAMTGLQDGSLHQQKYTLALQNICCAENSFLKKHREAIPFFAFGGWVFT